MKTTISKGGGTLFRNIFKFCRFWWLVDPPVRQKPAPNISKILWKYRPKILRRKQESVKTRVLPWVLPHKPPFVNLIVGLYDHIMICYKIYHQPMILLLITEHSIPMISSSNLSNETKSCLYLE